MSGKWLERAGFSIGARIKVKVTRGRLIVDVEPAADKVPAQKSYSYLSDVDIPQVFYCHDDPSPEPVPQSAPTRVNTLNPGVKHKAAGARAGWHERIRTALPRQLGSLLQNERARRDLDRGEIAVHAGVNRPHYGAIEQGSQQPNLSTFISLAWAFNEEPRDLFDRLLEQLGFSSGTRPLPAIL
jgi:DNA-binding XRE family transcriptional regulator